LPQYAAPTLPPPWSASSDLTKNVPTDNDGIVMTVEERAEMMQALKTAYSDSTGMPDNVKKMVKKYDIKTTEQLTKEMHRTSTSIGQARKLLHQLQDAKTKHRKSWLKHLETLMTTLEKQFEAFEEQQKDYQERIQTSRKEIHTSRRTMQRLNAQAAEAAIPEQVIEEDDQVEPPLQDSEEAELRCNVNKMLKKCLKSSAAKDMIELQSDDDDSVMAVPASKRQRSCDHGSGNGSS
jgi:chromosome segregation ATPase